MNQQSRLEHWMQHDTKRGSSRWIAVTGGKGGVGKTNLALALALTAASWDQRTVLIDGDLGLANIDILLDLDPGDNLASVVMSETSATSALVEVAYGLRVLPGASGVTHMADLGRSEISRLMRAIEELDDFGDLVVVDTGAGVSRSVIEFCEMCGEVLVVSTPEPTSIRDAYAVIKVLQQRAKPLKIWLVVNMADTIFEARETARRISEVAERFLGTKIATAGYVLSDYSVRAAVRERQPFSLLDPESDAARGVRVIGEKMGLDDVARREEPSRVLERMSDLFSRRGVWSEGEH